MAFFDLPTTLSVNGTEYEIFSDYRIALGIIEALNDAELSDEDRAEVLLSMLYPAFSGYTDDSGNEFFMPPEDYGEAINVAMDYINGGKKDDGIKRPKQMDWVQDFPIIVAPINKIAGYEVRSVDYLHWYTFLSYFNEIGECLFSQVVTIRKKLATGAKMDKADKEFYKNNRDLVDFEQKYTTKEDEILKQWT